MDYVPVQADKARGLSPRTGGQTVVQLFYNISSVQTLLSIKYSVLNFATSGKRGTIVGVITVNTFRFRPSWKIKSLKVLTPCLSRMFQFFGFDDTEEI